MLKLALTPPIVKFLQSDKQTIRGVCQTAGETLCKYTKKKEGNITFVCDKSPTALNGANSPLPNYIAVCVGIPYENKNKQKKDCRTIFFCAQFADICPTIRCKYREKL